MLTRFSSWQILASSAVPIVCPNDVTEDVLATIIVPAGAMGINGILRVTTAWQINNNANLKTMISRFGGQLGRFRALNTSLRDIWSETIYNRGVLNSQTLWGNNSSGFGGNDTGPVVTLNVDTSVSQNYTFSAQKAIAGDTIILESYLIELLQKN